MGRKRNRKREYLLLFVAGLILLVSSGCATPEQTGGGGYPLSGKELLTPADIETVTEKNQKIVSEYDTKPPADEALFTLGLIYAHYKNPHRDYNKSIASFRKLIEDFPQSPLTEEAKIWVRTLITFEQTREQLQSVKVQNERMRSQLMEITAKLQNADAQRNKRVSAYEFFFRTQRLLSRGEFDRAVEENQKLLSKYGSTPMADEALFSMGLIYAHHDNPKKDYNKALSFFKKLTKEFPQSSRVEEAKIWISVLDSIEKAKQVDIEIEGKKKELLR